MKFILVTAIALTGLVSTTGWAGLSFSQWCKSPRLTASQSSTVRILLKEAKSTDCDQAQTNLENYHWLVLGSKGLTNVEPIASLTHLTRLVLFNNNISDVSPLKTLVNLRALDLANNQVSDIAHLKLLWRLSRLKLNDNPLKSINAIESLAHLEILELARTEVRDFSVLKHFKMLSTLNLSNNEIGDATIEAFPHFEFLKHLNLSSNNITNVSSLGALSSLWQLLLWRNPIPEPKVCPLQPETICRF